MTQKKAIVMGATSGIGMRVALELAERGWSVGIAGPIQELVIINQKILTLIVNMLAMRK